MSIKVKNLIEELQKLNPEHYIVMSSDTEGSSYEFLHAIYINHKLQDGKVYLAKLTPDLKEVGYTEDDVSEEGVNCVVLYPGDDAALLEKLIVGDN